MFLLVVEATLPPHLDGETADDNEQIQSDARINRNLDGLTKTKNFFARHRACIEEHESVVAAHEDEELIEGFDLVATRLYHGLCSQQVDKVKEGAQREDSHCEDDHLLLDEVKRRYDEDSPAKHEEEAL